MRTGTWINPITDQGVTDELRRALNVQSIENIPAGWRARETYRILSADEFVEEFALAPPGKDFELYSESRHKRKK